MQQQRLQLLWIDLTRLRIARHGDDAQNAELPELGPGVM
jgi:hypothetical protein